MLCFGLKKITILNFVTIMNTELKSKFCHFCEIFPFFYLGKTTMYFVLKVYTLIEYNIIYIYVFFRTLKSAVMKFPKRGGGGCMVLNI
jgi:hypothetical protein